MPQSQPSPQFAVWVEFQIRDDAMPQFMPLMLANARASLAQEEGCRQFDVMVPRPASASVHLFELYDSQAAFEEHLQSAHFKDFAAATNGMITERKILTLDLVAGSPGSRTSAA